MIFDNGENGSVGGGAVDVGDIGHSLRFRRVASAYVSRTPAVNGNRKTWTLSTYTKRGTLGASQGIFEGWGVVGNTGNMSLRFTASDTLQFQANGSGNNLLWETAAVFRDVGSHYNIVLQFDSTQALGANAVKLFVNGFSVALTYSIAGGSYVQNADWFVNGAGFLHLFGTYTTTNYADMYLSRSLLVDGVVLPPTSFGYLNTTSNAWVTLSQSAVKSVVDAGGANSFMLDFDNGASLTTLGADKSIKGNNWTLNNMSITAGPTYDWMLDTPSNNFSTFNPLSVRGAASILQNGNLTFPSGTSLQTRTIGTISVGVPIYFEGRFVAAGSGVGYLLSGVSDSEFKAVAEGTARPLAGTWCLSDDGTITSNGAAPFASGLGSFTSSDIYRIAIDPVSHSMWVGKNSTWIGDPVAKTGASITGLPTTIFPHFMSAYSGSASSQDVNFGQRPFAQTIPAGYTSLCTQNFPVPTTAALTPPNQFNIALDTGAAIKSTSEAIFPNNFFEWIKNRGAVNNHQLLDIVRGNTAVLQSNTTAAETTYTAPANASVGWVWKAGGTSVTNTAGTITSQVSANPDAGFSVVTWTGNNTNNATVGHGLGVAPRLVTVKRRTGGVGSWATYVTSLGTGYLFLEKTFSYTATNTYFTAHSTASLLPALTNSGEVNGTDTYVAYCFSEISGYSKIGSYTGNGSADGPFIYCGFRPRFWLVKRTDTGSDWLILDSARNTVNVLSSDIYANLTNAEGTNATADFCSNGVKLRTTGAWANASGGTYIYYAVAESTFNYSNAR